MATPTKNHRRHSRASTNNHLDEIRNQAMSIGDSVRAMAVTAGEAAGESLSPVEEYVREKPIKSMFFALAAGALLGAFLLRR